jgi:hypothetical protein
MLPVLPVLDVEYDVTVLDTSAVRESVKSTIEVPSSVRCQLSLVNGVWAAPVAGDGVCITGADV